MLRAAPPEQENEDARDYECEQTSCRRENTPIARVGPPPRP